MSLAPLLSLLSKRVNKMNLPFNQKSITIVAVSLAVVIAALMYHEVAQAYNLWIPA